MQVAADVLVRQCMVGAGRQGGFDVFANGCFQRARLAAVGHAQGVVQMHFVLPAEIQLPAQ